MIAGFERSFLRLLRLLYLGPQLRGQPPARGIDFGSGAKLGPEDVLETHFQRLARARRVAPAPAKTTRTQTVPIQVSDNLVTAITVLAPNLAPLTELAEDVAYALPPVQPGPAFRASLHQALEQTHRQHAAQRVLGTREGKALSHAGSWSGVRLGWIFALLGVLLGALTVLVVIFRFWLPAKQRPAANPTSGNLHTADR